MRKRDLAIFLATIVLVFYGINAGARNWLGAPSRYFVPTDQRVVILRKDPTNPPSPPPGKQSMLLMGSSHIYGLPGLEPSAPLREESDKTMLVEMAQRIPGKNTLFYRLSYPNFLGFEMLTCVENLRRKGHHFDTVVLGITWQNLARNRNLRYAIEQLYGKDDFVEYLRRHLSDPAIAAAPDVLAAVDAAQQKRRAESEREASISHADAIENELASLLQEKLFLYGHSEALRARIYRLIVLRAQDFFIKQIGEESYQYGVVQSDLDFNVKCMLALFHVLAQDRCRVLIYLSPDRSDLPPLIDVSNKDAVLSQLRAEARDLGF